MSEAYRVRESLAAEQAFDAEWTARDGEPRCLPHGDTGPRCMYRPGHPVATGIGQHRFKCAGEHCVGLSWPASVHPHPNDCVSPRPAFTETP